MCWTPAVFQASCIRLPPPLEREPFRVQIVVRQSQQDPGPPPKNLIRHIRYTGSGDWIHLQLGSWGTCFADLRAGWAAAIIVPSLAAQPETVSSDFLNTLLNNFLTRHGYAMLHATGLVRDDRIVLLMAPHNSGKSTTALHLTLSGAYQLLSDSQVYVTQTPEGTQLTGFPIGLGKLRPDVLAHFPSLKAWASPEKIRDETKFRIDLRAYDPRLVAEEALYPSEVILCLLRLNGKAHSTVVEATLDQAWDAVMLNSLHYDDANVWQKNLARIEPLLKTARLYHLTVGTNPDEIVNTLSTIFER